MVDGSTVTLTNATMANDSIFGTNELLGGASQAVASGDVRSIDVRRADPILSTAVAAAAATVIYLTYKSLWSRAPSY
jgi:hypothetical protein